MYGGEQMIRKKIKIGECLFLLLGIFSTIQLLLFAGVTIFNILLILTSVVGVLIRRHHLKFDKYFLLLVLSCLLTFFLSFNSTITNGFKKAAIIEGVLYLFLSCIYLLMNTEYLYAEKLIRGFKISCNLTLFWSIMQLTFYYIFHIDINTFVFSNLLKISGARSDYFAGNLIPSGFFYHRATLIPIFIYLIFSTSNPYILVLTLLVGFLTRSTALIMGLVLAVVFKIVLFYREFLFRKINKRKFLFFLLVIIIAFLGIIIFRVKVMELVGYVLMRISDATSNKADNSSVVHFLYYKSLIPIIKTMNIANFFFGTGVGTSGQHYVLFNGQYASMESWVVESDYINIFLNQGLIGLLLWIYLLIRIVYLSYKSKFWNNIAFITTIAFVGVMYNIQFTWFIVIEFAILILTRKKIDVFNFMSRKEAIKI